MFLVAPIPGLLPVQLDQGLQVGLEYGVIVFLSGILPGGQGFGNHLGLTGGEVRREFNPLIVIAIPEPEVGSLDGRPIAAVIGNGEKLAEFWIDPFLVLQILHVALSLGPIFSRILGH